MLSGENLYSLLIMLPVYQLIFFTILLFTVKKNDNKPKFYLGILIFSLTLYMACQSLFFLEYYSFFRTCYVFYTPLLLLIIPFYYLYINSLSSCVIEMDKRKMVLLFLPAIITLLLNVINAITVPVNTLQVFIFKGFSFNDQNISREASRLQQIHIVGNGILIAWQLIFITVRFMRIFSYTKNRNENTLRQYSYLNTRYMVFTFASIFIFISFNGIVHIFYPQLSNGVLLVYHLCMLACISIIGYLAVKQDTVYQQVKKVNSNGNIQNNALKQNNKKPAETQYLDEIENLKSLLATEKIYLDKNLTIYDLAKKMNTGFRELSYILNKVMQTNFYGLVNEYRVNEAKEILSRKQFDHYSLDAISDKVGFRSRSSFYACFKKMTGQTPAEYKNTHHRND
ncbi:MAG: AraC family transcriptional regulator [Bacteroidales bacterium]